MNGTVVEPSGRRHTGRLVAKSLDARGWRATLIGGDVQAVVLSGPVTLEVDGRTAAALVTNVRVGQVLVTVDLVSNGEERAPWLPR